MLIALRTEEVNQSSDGCQLLKSDIIRLAEPLCSTSFYTEGNVATGPKSYYTAWSSMQTLLEKDLIAREGRPLRYYLTPEGRELAIQLKEVSGDSRHDLTRDLATPSPVRLSGRVVPSSSSPRPSTPLSVSSRSHHPISSSSTFLNPSVGDDTTSSLSSSVSSSSSSVSSSSLRSSSSLENFPWDEAELLLVLDERETRQAWQKNLARFLDARGISTVTRTLILGDMTWIARPKTSVVGQNFDDLVLDFVCERKTSLDLDSSIDDGRYAEQSFRLQKCGINHVFYILEGDMQKLTPRPAAAAMNLQVQKNCMTVFTENVFDTARYLTQLTYAVRRYYGMSPSVPTAISFERRLNTVRSYTDFQNENSKGSNELQDLWAQWLMKLNGVSEERSFQIVERYPTPTHLLQAYEQCQSEEQRKNLLADFVTESGRRLGPRISAFVYRCMQ